MSEEKSEQFRNNNEVNQLIESTEIINGTLDFLDRSYLKSLLDIITSSSLPEDEIHKMVGKLDEESISKTGLRVSEFPYYFPNLLSSYVEKEKYKIVFKRKLGVSSIKSLHAISEREIYAVNENGFLFEIHDLQPKANHLIKSGDRIKKIQALPNGTVAILDDARITLWKLDAQRNRRTFDHCINKIKDKAVDFAFLPTGDIVVVVVADKANEIYLMHKTDKDYESEPISIANTDLMFNPMSVSIGLNLDIIVGGQGGIRYLRNINGRYQCETIKEDIGWFFKPLIVSPSEIIYRDCSREDSTLHELRISDGRWLEKDVSADTQIRSFQPLPNAKILVTKNKGDIKIVSRETGEGNAYCPYMEKITDAKMLPSGRIVSTYVDGTVIVLDGQKREGNNE